MRDIRVASVQMEHIAGDKAANLAKVRRLAAGAAEKGAEIVAFPECCLTGYWFLRKLSRDDIAALAEPVPGGPSSDAVCDLAASLHVTVGAGLVEKGEDGNLYNTYLVAMPDGRTARHRKLHCFVSKHMASGSEFTVFDTPHGCKVGVLICYDNNLIENVRMTALLGAEVILAPHQTGGCRTGDPHVMGVIDRSLWDRRKEAPEAIEAAFRGEKGRAWLMRWLPSRAHDNGIYLVFSNGVGVDDDEVRTGNAMILDPYGRILAETWKADDDMIVADLDAASIRNTSGRRWMRSRRPELYGLIAQRTGIEQDTRAVRFFYESES